MPPSQSRDRHDFTIKLVMTALVDDYENLETIIPEVARGAGDQVVPLRDEIVQAIKDLISAGYAQSFELSPLRPHATAIAFNPERVDDLYYYYLAAPGKKILQNA
jgi:hypothetical protein